MPPKGQQKPGAGAAKQTEPKKEKEEAQEDALQAVILADSYDSRFSPLTSSSKPRCLLPFLNAPLIDWTLESLSLAGVQTVFILARNGLTSIRQHVSDDLKDGLNLGLDIKVIPTPEARSIGDAMRELDAKQIIRTDFILCHGDCVGNIDLESAVSIHKERRLRDKDAIMTICTMPVAQGSATRSPGDRALHFISPSTAQLLHYETPQFSTAKSSSSSTAKLPMEIFLADVKDGGVSELDVRNDLVEAGIDICSVDVPPLFSENFDYQSLREHFVPGILTSDLLDSRIYLHIASSSPHSTSSSISTSTPSNGTGGWGYAARVRDTKSYDAVSRDVLRKWTYPLTPGANCPGGEMYAVRNGLRYVGEKVKLSRTCTLGPSTLLGPSTSLANGSSVTHSVLGPRVTIGTNSKISGSYIWADAQVGANCRVEQSIIGQGVQILNGVTISRGCLLADGCKIGPDVQVRPFSRVGLISEKEARRDSDDEEDDDDDGNGDDTEEEEEPSGRTPQADSGFSSQLGGKSIGYLWTPIGESSNDDEDSEDEEDTEDPKVLAILRLGADLQSLHLQEEIADEDDLSSIAGDSDLASSDDEDEDNQEVLAAAAAAGGALASVSADSRLSDFRSEARASLARAFDEGHTVDNAAIELKTLRMASNVPLKEVRKIVIEFVLMKCNVEEPKQIASTLERWGGLIENVAADDQVEALAIVQSFCALHSSHTKLFVPLLKKFYNDDIVSDESILAWWKDPISRETSVSNGGQTVLELRKAAEGVVRYIVESQDESDDDEEEEQEGESD